MPRKYFIPTLPHLLAAPDQPFIHRDLSALQFNERVLAEARTSQNPLLERIKFLAITASNLDEFFMIRYAALDKSIRLASQKGAQERAFYVRLRNAILEAVGAFAAKQAETLDLLASALEAKGVALVREPAPDEESFALGKTLFDQQILPHLPPPEPFAPGKTSVLENLRTAAMFENGLWIPIPRTLPRVLLSQPVLGKPPVYVFFLDDLLVSHLGPSYRIPARPGLARMTRDGDIALDLEDEDDPAAIPDIVRSGLGNRETGRPVRLQYMGDMPGEMLTQTLTALKISPRQAFPAPGTLHLHGLWTLVKQLPEDLRAQPGMSYPPMETIMPSVFRKTEGLFEEIKSRDLLLHHPYESFESYVRFLKTAAEDPQVTMIQQTVYRTDAGSPVIEILKGAAKKKKVRVLVELRARFDEANNLKLTEELKKAGAEVAFGFGGLKLHAKIAAVTRKEDGGERIYTHLSTGNYNAATARLYEDLVLFTARPEIGQDALHFFDFVSKGKIPDAFTTLVHAPTQLHRRLVQHIQAEIEAAKAKKPARIAVKINALVDPQIIEKLYEASQAGVTVDLIVRGACSLIPGIKGLSENIRVVSVVDRFLEHSRIYYFHNADRIYLSSADWMPRNFFSRLELAFPLLDPEIRRIVRDVILPVYFADTVKGRELTPQGTWKKRGLSNTHTPWFKKTCPDFVNQSARAQFFLEEFAQKQNA
jgi:polyphosphate kinase